MHFFFWWNVAPHIDDNFIEISDQSPLPTPPCSPLPASYEAPKENKLEEKIPLNQIGPRENATNHSLQQQGGLMRLD